MTDPIAERLAEDLWQTSRASLQARPRPGKPLFLQMAGVPLAGKSTLARAIARATTGALLHVENDAVRIVVTEALGRDEPAFDGQENHLTYAASRALARRALTWGAHAIHDATNLTESERAEGYRTADLAGRATVVLFVTAPDGRLEARASQLPAHRQRAHQALGHRQLDPQACSRPHLILDGTRPPETNLTRLQWAAATAQLGGVSGH